MIKAKKIVTVAFMFMLVMLFAVSVSAAELDEVTFDGSEITVSGSCTTGNQVQVAVFDYHNQPIYFATIPVANGSFDKTLDAAFALEADETYTVKVADYNGKNVASATFVPHEHSFGDAWVFDGANHWHACACGEQTDRTAHTYSEEKSDGTNHWLECICGAKTDVTAHTYGAWITDEENHWHACACGAKADITAHTYGAWITDAENHWHECTCGKKADTAAHTYGAWTVTKEATATERGSKERTCSVCSYKGTAVIEAGINSPNTGDTGNTVAWIAVLLITGGGLTTLGVVIRKRRMQYKPL